MSAQPARSTVTTKPVSVAYRSDGGPARYRLGLVALKSDVATEYDWQKMLPEDVSFYTTRVDSPPSVNIENLRTIGPHLRGASDLILPNQRLDAIAYSCTSGTVALGFEQVARAVRGPGRETVPVVTPITSAIRALRQFGALRISLMTPYIDSVNQAMAAYLTDAGIEVMNIGSFCLESDLDMADLDPEAIYEAALEVCDPQAQALFISCTAIRAVQVLERLESQLQRPVVSSIQTLFWEALREAGYKEPIVGYGSLLRA